MEQKGYSLSWEKRFDDLYFDAALNDIERMWAIKDFIKQERKNSIMDVLLRITNMPIRLGITSNQEEALNEIRKWYSTECIPGILKDYHMLGWSPNSNYK